MSYIITAKVSLGIEENAGGKKELVEARILSEHDGNITFDIPGDFSNQRELTRQLCNSLIDAGFVSFRIGHSY